MYLLSSSVNMALALMMLAIALISNPARGDDVFIRGVGEGRGYTRAKGPVCYVVTPAHVVRDSPEITIIGRNRRESAGILRQVFSLDLAAIEVPKSSLACATRESPKFGETQFDSVSKGFLQMREEDGSLSRMPVIIRNVGVADIVVEPQSKRDQIHKGMSGAALMIDDARAGILMSVEDQHGRVIKINWANQVLDAFFTPATGDSDIAEHALGDLTGDYPYSWDADVAVNRDKGSTTKYIVTLVDSLYGSDT